MRTDTNRIVVDIAVLGEATVVAKCLEMPEELLGLGFLAGCGGYELHSHGILIITPGRLSLPGNAKVSGNTLTTYTFPTSAEADAWITVIKGLIDAVNEELAVKAKAAVPESLPSGQVIRGELVAATSFGYFPGDNEQDKANKFDYLIVRCERGQVDGYAPGDAEVRLIAKEESDGK